METEPTADFVAATEETGAFQERITTLETELAAATDQKLRALAELENFRLRTNRLLQEEKKYSSMELLRELLPIWDNIQRTLDAAEKTQDVTPLIDGIQMVSEQFLGVLDRHDCKRITALHTPFDPNIHASIAVQPTDEYPANTVLYESQPGFKLHDRVVRPSQVVLATHPIR